MDVFRRVSQNAGSMKVSPVVVAQKPLAPTEPDIR
jgi:hypothetical protein